MAPSTCDSNERYADLMEVPLIQFISPTGVALSTMVWRKCCWLPLAAVGPPPIERAVCRRVAAPVGPHSHLGRCAADPDAGAVQLLLPEQPLPNWDLPAHPMACVGCDVA